MDAYKGIKHDVNISAPMGPQLALAEFLSGGGYDKHLRRLRRIYQTQAARFADRIIVTCPEGTGTSRPRGGQVIRVEMRVGVDSVALLEECQRRGHVRPWSAVCAGRCVPELPAPQLCCAVERGALGRHRNDRSFGQAAAQRGQS